MKIKKELRNKSKRKENIVLLCMVHFYYRMSFVCALAFHGIRFDLYTHMYIVSYALHSTDTHTCMHTQVPKQPHVTTRYTCSGFHFTLQPLNNNSNKNSQLIEKKLYSANNTRIAFHFKKAPISHCKCCAHSCPF